MSAISRRSLIVAALAVGAVPLRAGTIRPAHAIWRFAPERFPHGVASGDPDTTSLILWTRCEPRPGEEAIDLDVEVAHDSGFERVVARRTVVARASQDWTVRVLVADLAASTSYWYRFVDGTGAGSRVGRTRTAPEDIADVEARFAVVSCQNANLGPLNAWRRMIFDDERAADRHQLDFVLHLGDFVYETVWLPEDRPQGYFDRTLRPIVRYPDGERHEDYHVPTSLRDYRALYKAYLLDPDLQNARARWPFVCIWDNGEYSNDGWQGLQRFGTRTISAQTRKVAANQAWFEFIPARLDRPGRSLESFDPPVVIDAPVTVFDPAGLGLEPNNLAAIGSLKGYRVHRWGRHVDIILTDQRSYRSEDYTADAQARGLVSSHFPQLVPFETLQQIDAGETWRSGHPEATLTTGDGAIANFRRHSRPRTLLGESQRRWLLDQLSASRATWKIWGNTVATFDMRADPQHLPASAEPRWSGAGYAGFARTDHSTAYAERSQIFEHVRDNEITGFVTLSGDRHSFWAGYSASSLPPDQFDPIGVNFVVGSISSPGMAEALEYILPRDHPLRTLYLLDSADDMKPEPTVNLLLKYGVLTCLDYAVHRDFDRARRMSDPNNAPHVRFVDMAGHGYGVVRADADHISVEFVCIPRPVVDPGGVDGGDVRYRVIHRAPAWQPGETPVLTSISSEGNLGLSA
ncbi:MAG: alkaline phosphatase D family protein [Sphingomonas sp.]